METIESVLFGKGFDTFLVEIYKLLQEKYDAYKFRDLIAKKSEVGLEYNTYDHGLVEMISKCLVAMAAKYPKQASHLITVLLAPFGSDSFPTEPWEAEARKRVRDSSYYYTLGVTLGIFRSMNWLDQNLPVEEAGELDKVLPESFETLVFCDNALVDIPQIYQAFESEISKAIKPAFRHQVPYRWETERQTINVLSKAFKQRTFALSEFGNLLLTQLAYAILSSWSGMSLIQLIDLAAKDFQKRK